MKITREHILKADKEKFKKKDFSKVIELQKFGEHFGIEGPVKIMFKAPKTVAERQLVMALTYQLFAKELLKYKEQHDEEMPDEVRFEISSTCETIAAMIACTYDEDGENRLFDENTACILENLDDQEFHEQFTLFNITARLDVAEEVARKKSKRSNTQK